MHSRALAAAVENVRICHEMVKVSTAIRLLVPLLSFISNSLQEFEDESEESERRSAGVLWQETQSVWGKLACHALSGRQMCLGGYCFELLSTF